MVRQQRCPNAAIMAENQASDPGRVDIVSGNSTHLPSIKMIADGLRHEFGFLPRVIFEASLNSDELIVAIDNGQVVGFCRFHLRRDGICTIYEIAVLANSRRRGIGTKLIDHVATACRRKKMGRLRLKCPVGSAANKFYAAHGFVGPERCVGRRRLLNSWTFPLKATGDAQ